MDNAAYGGLVIQRLNIKVNSLFTEYASHIVCDMTKSDEEKV